MPKMKIRKVPANYRIMGRHIVVEDGYSMPNGKRKPGYRIVGELRGKRTRG